MTGQPGADGGRRDTPLAAEVDLHDDTLESIPRPFWRTFRESFSAAFSGLARTIATQRNMKVHVVSAFMVLLVGMALELDLATRAALIFCAAAVWFAEILNTALEAFVDLHVRQYHRLAMLAKDAAAAGVLVLAAATVLIFAEVLRANLHQIVAQSDQVLRFAALGVPATGGVVYLLWGNRKGVTPWLALAASLGLLVPLALTAIDRLFTASAVGIILLARYARARYPGTMPRGAPVPPGALRAPPAPSSVRAGAPRG
ncbi:MAG: diacylglycerol kinase family protein [Deltaproteobacteria bacterium]|nr:diacylglycerol kinase family protein [Deltaproteobacteria bacterium]